MAKKYWINGIILFTIILQAPLSMACGGGWDYRGFTLFFNPFEKTQPKHNYLYNPFTYTYDLDYTYNPPSETDVLVAEWAKQLNTQQQKEVFQLLFDDRLSDVNALLEAKRNNQPYRNVKLSSKLKLYASIYENVDLLTYLQLIQDYSYRVNSFSDEWEYAYHAKKADPYKLKNNQERAEALFQQLIHKKDATSAFIKPRLAYHLVRSAYFNRQFTKAQAYLKQYAPSYNANDKGLMNSWLEGMRGGVALHTENKSEAVLHYARVFNNAAHSHYQAYIDLKWLSNNQNLLDALSVATDKNDSIAIYAAASATNSQLASGVCSALISEINDEEIRFFMWYRELQKVEETYFHPKICNKSFERWDEYGHYLQENSDVITKNYTDFKLLTQSLYHLSSDSKYKNHYANGMAYIKLMDENYSAIPSEDNAKTAIAKYQRIAFKLYRQVRTNEEIDTEDVIQLLDLWKTDFFSLPENAQTLNYILRDFVAPHYLYHQGDTLNALFLWAISDGTYYWDERPVKKEVIFTNSEVANVLMNYTLNTEQYLNLEARMKQKDSPLLAWANDNKVKVSVSDKKSNDLLFYKYVRDENWKMAERELFRTNLHFKKRKYFDPFLIHYDGYLSPTALDSSKPMMTARQFLKLGAKLKAQVKKNPTAENELKYGQYLLSTTFHGHNSIADDADLGYLSSTWYEFKPWFFDVKKFGTYVGYYYFYESFEFEASKHELDYYHCYKAEKLFKRAYAHLTDKEDKAKCCFLLAKCVQKRAPIPPMVMNEYDYLEPQEIEYKGKKYDSYIYHSFTNPYLLEMENLYSDTKTYREAQSECSYLRYILK